MEYGLRARITLLSAEEMWVLILVLMEYGLRDIDDYTSSPSTTGLNPCFNGIWSASPDNGLESPPEARLNPCFNGIWSARVKSVRICV